MNVALAFTRVLFFILSIFYMTTYMLAVSQEPKMVDYIIGITLGVIFGFVLIGFEILFKKHNLRSFNMATVGIFFGFLMGKALTTVFDTILAIGEPSIMLKGPSIEIVKISLFLFGIYLGTIMTLKAADELYVSIPFTKFTPTAHKKKDLLLDLSTLSDPRVIDLASSGIVDNHLIIPKFVTKELHEQVESANEHLSSKAKRSLEIIKKLEEIPDIELRYNDTDFPEVKESTGKLIRLARLLDCNILSCDISKVQTAMIEGIKVVNLNNLSNALKPLTQAGENLKVKIQRYGKEPMQGVGYLEDGTMVVVNSGGNHIGETIDAQVLSVKHTSSGRMIFCNALDGEKNLQ